MLWRRRSSYLLGQGIQVFFLSSSSSTSSFASLASSCVNCIG